MRSLTASHWCMRRRGHLRMYADVANPAAAVHCRGQVPCRLVSAGLDPSMFHWFWSDGKSAFSEGMYTARSVLCSEHLEQVSVLCWLLLPSARSVAGGATCFATDPDLTSSCASPATWAHCKPAACTVARTSSAHNIVGAATTHAYVIGP